jgi:hypothetical protein
MRRAVGYQTVLKHAMIRMLWVCHIRDLLEELGKIQLEAFQKLGLDYPIVMSHRLSLVNANP